MSKTKVVLTFDHDEYGSAESTVSLEEVDARRLVREGNARVVEPVSTAKKAPAKKAAAKPATSPAAGDNGKA